MRRIISLTLLFILMISGAAHADTAINAAGADILKKQVQDTLQWRFDMEKMFGQGLAMDGDITVVPKGSFYEVTLPHLSVLTGPKNKLDIGTIILNARPGEKLNSWLIQGTLPSAMTYADARGVPQAQITIGGQHFLATWFPEGSALSKMDFLLEKIQIKGTAQNPITAEIGKVKSVIDLNDNGDGTWSGPGSFETSGLIINVPGVNPASFSVGKMSSSFTYDHLDLRQAIQMREDIAKALKAGRPQTDQEKRDFITKYLLKSPVTMKGAEGTLKIEKILMRDTGAPQQPRHQFALEQLVLSGASSKDAQDKNRLTLKTSFDGLYMTPLPVALVELIPRSMNAEIAFDNLPVKQMTDLFSAALEKSVNAPQSDPAAQKQAKAEAEAALAQAPKILEDAGATVTVQNTFVKSDAVDAQLDGRINASATSPLGGIGKMTLSIKGLDEVVKTMQASAMKPGADPNALGYLGALTIVEMRGQPDKAADGKSLRNYVLELTPEGKTLLNGQDISTPPQAPPAVPATEQPNPLPHSHPMIPAAPPQTAPAPATP